MNTVTLPLMASVAWKQNCSFFNRSSQRACDGHKVGKYFSVLCISPPVFSKIILLNLDNVGRKRAGMNGRKSGHHLEAGLDLTGLGASSF